MSYPEDKATKTWNDSELSYSIVLHSAIGHFCGYVRFPKRPVIETGYNGILIYAPVHGGLTYASEKEGGMVYGFDCGHCDDEDNPDLKDIDWLTTHCEQMGRVIKAAVPFESRYLLAKTNEEKAEVIDEYRKACGELHEENYNQNFGVMIRLLGGDL